MISSVLPEASGKDHVELSMLVAFSLFSVKNSQNNQWYEQGSLNFASKPGGKGNRFTGLVSRFHEVPGKPGRRYWAIKAQQNPLLPTSKHYSSTSISLQWDLHI